ncbi:abc transporter a family member 7-like [Hordeum vulgare]|nr:abc transporter a family member 7-like [Hordeum vulgare]
MPPGRLPQGDSGDGASRLRNDPPLPSFPRCRLRPAWRLVGPSWLSAQRWTAPPVTKLCHSGHILDLPPLPVSRAPPPSWNPRLGRAARSDARRPCRACPTLLYVPVVVIQRLINRKIGKPQYHCGCGCTCVDTAVEGDCGRTECGVRYSMHDQVATCPIPIPLRWPDVCFRFQLPPSESTTVRTTSELFDGLPDSTCRDSWSCPAAFLVIGGTTLSPKVCLSDQLFPALTLPFNLTKYVLMLSKIIPNRVPKNLRKTDYINGSLADELEPIRKYQRSTIQTVIGGEITLNNRPSVLEEKYSKNEHDAAPLEYGNKGSQNPGIPVDSASSDDLAFANGKAHNSDFVDEDEPSKEITVVSALS